MTPDNQIPNTSTSITDSSLKPSYRNHPILFFLLVMLLLVSAGLGFAYYLKITETDNTSCNECNQIADENDNVDEETENTSDDTDLYSSVPQDWFRTYDSSCELSLAHPSEQFSEALSESGNWVVRSYVDEEDTPQIDELDISFVHDEIQGNSHFITSMVYILCEDNDTGVTLSEFVDTTTAELVSEGRTVTSTKEIEKWGVNVVVQSYAPMMMGEVDDDYFVVTPSKVYTIKHITMSEEDDVVDAANKIFDSLVFRD